MHIQMFGILFRHITNIWHIIFRHGATLHRSVTPGSDEYTYSYTSTEDDAPNAPLRRADMLFGGAGMQQGGEGLTPEEELGAYGPYGMNCFSPELKKEVVRQRDTLLECFGMSRKVVRGGGEAFELFLPVSRLYSLYVIALRRMCVSVLDSQAYKLAAETAAQFQGHSWRHKIAQVLCSAPNPNNKIT